jgi:N-acetylglutamate synthase-like GNAT family acetyltransferase
MFLSQLIKILFSLRGNVPHSFQNANATGHPIMSSPDLRIRRANVDDLDALKKIWEAMRLPADELEKRLTEFQIAESADGEIVGAIGIQISRQHALLHAEGYADFSLADAARNLFWARIQTLASNHGIFRLWTQERSPFWKSFGFQPPTAEILSRLPAEWKNEFEGGWLTFQLKDEEKIAAALEKEFAQFMAAEKKDTDRVAEQARTLKTILTIIGFTIGILSFGVAAYLLIHRLPFLQPH